MTFADIPTLSTEKLIEIAEHYEARAELYTTRTLARFCKSQNGQFMKERWLSYIKGECGKSGRQGKSSISRWQGRPFAPVMHWQPSKVGAFRRQHNGKSEMEI